MKKLIVGLLLIAAVLAIFGYIAFRHLQTPPTPPRDLNALESTVITVTATLDPFLVETPSPASRTIVYFSSYVQECSSPSTFIFKEFKCDIKAKGDLGIFVVQDKTTSQLLFEDGTWSVGTLDAPHHRSPGLPRLPFPIASGGDVK